MPSPNGAQKAANKAQEKKAAALGQNLARKRSQDFKSKIDGWNETGAGIARDDEIVVVEEQSVAEDVLIVAEEETGSDDGGFKVAPHESEPTTPKTPRSTVKVASKPAAQRKTSREVDLQKKAWVRRKSKPAVDVTPEVKEATTPKKRVVSDGHWRRDRTKKDEQSPEKDAEKEKPKDTTPKPVIVRRSVVSVGLKTPPSIQKFIEEVDTETARVRKVPRRSRSRDRDADKEGTPDYESSGTKVYVKRRRRSRTVGEQGKSVNPSESSFTAPSSSDRPSTATDITIPDDAPMKADTRRPSTAPKERATGRLSGDMPLRNRSANIEEPPRGVSKVKRQSLPKHDEAPPKPRIPAGRPPTRIQGWLADMPEDPFAAPSEPSIVFEAVELPRKRTPRSGEDAEYDDGRRRSSGRTSKLRTAPAYQDDGGQQASGGWDTVDDWVNESSPTNLRRSGARRNTQSPTKDRTPRGASASLEYEHTGPADISRRVSRRSTYNHGHDRAISHGHGRLPTIASADSLATYDQTYDDSALSRLSDGDEPLRGGTGLSRRLTKHSDLMSVLSNSRDDGNLARTRSSRTRRRRSDKITVADLMNDITTDELKYQRELRTLVDGVIPVLLTYVMSKADAARTPGSRKSSLHDNPALTQPIYDMGVALERLKTFHKHVPMHESNELLLWAQGAAKLYSDYLRVWRLGFEDIVVNLAPAEGAEAHETNHQRRKSSGTGPSSEGERVDVAYLLKRPLVRVKNISKTLKALADIRPSPLADDMTLRYQGLVTEARQRSNDERARMEDESAAAIDPTRARDPRNLVQLNGVTIDPARSVRARDFFDMELYHSSGQQLGCKVELIRRDNPSSLPGPGDVLFCEISSTGRWLLFPPVLASYLSARQGEKDGEIIVMLRGLGPSAGEWREFMTLQSSNEQSTEWVDMLGSSPMPPRLTRQSSFNALRLPSKGYDAPSSPTESEVPIGERARPSDPNWDGSDVNNNAGTSSYSDIRNTRPKRYHGLGSSPSNNLHIIAEQSHVLAQQRPVSGSPKVDGPDNERRSRYRHARSKTEWSSDHEDSKQKNYSVWLPSSDRGDSDHSADEDDRPTQRPAMHRRTSSVPSNDMPTIPKLRKVEEPHRSNESRKLANEPSSAPAKIQKRQSSSAEQPRALPDTPETPTQTSRPTSLGLRQGVLPSFTPKFMQKNRRSSSPLKHEYEPSTSSESFSDSDLSDEDDIHSVTSHSSVEEGVSTIGDLKDFSKNGFARVPSQSSRKSTPSIDLDSVAPSDSPSQAPYRSVPPTNNGSAKSVACILAWNDRGSWDTMHPEECEIVVTPGLIEAFDLSQAHAVAHKTGDLADSSPSAYGVRPLVALELTPLVPLRRGTALDISIRSPPTSSSLLRTSNNIMLRSRSPEECEKLYNLINRARIDNPTWIALQNARGPQHSNWAEAMDRRNAARDNASPSWIKSLSRKGSYRSKGSQGRSASIAASQSSVNTMTSAMSALRKFGNGGRIFNIAKSSITSREGTRSSGSDSLDSGAATPVPFDIHMGTPLGITNTKCRFYFREETTKWRDLGAARLTIMLPPRPDPSVPAEPGTTGMTKRVLITGKSKGETLLDVTLEERCFERVGRTGVAVTIWREIVGPNGELGRAMATGGVGSSQTKTYMIQMKSERDAAFTFSMVGKLRY